MGRDSTGWVCVAQGVRRATRGGRRPQGLERPHCQPQPHRLQGSTSGCSMPDCLARTTCDRAAWLGRGCTALFDAQSVAGGIVHRRAPGRVWGVSAYVIRAAKPARPGWGDSRTISGIHAPRCFRLIHLNAFSLRRACCEASAAALTAVFHRLAASRRRRLPHHPPPPRSPDTGRRSA